MRYLTWIVLACGLASPVAAQTVYNPTRVTFVASPDQNTIGPDNATPLLDHYDLNAYLQNGSGAIAFTQGLGKPTPDGTGTIGATLSPSFLGSIAGNTIYVARVSAVAAPAFGSLSSLSSVSNSFANVAAPRSATSVTVR